ncbi:MAG: DUF2959 family protein [Alphaproteobacteria bacterium]|nr:DUF2959 family protein [Alphaproteobacteria bacterium]
MTNRRKPIAAALLAAIAVGAASCASTYYATMEQFGVEKRDILVDRVKDARGEQAEAQQVFATALDEFKSLVDFDGGDLERNYDKLSASYGRAEKQANDVRARVKSVDDVGRRLFREWETELKQYSSPDLRAQSERQLTRTKLEFEALMSAMTRASGKMDPVLALYNDQVLYLKHNLNARAIASLESERVEIEQRIELLIAEMNESIAEADRFIANMATN